MGITALFQPHSFFCKMLDFSLHVYHLISYYICFWAISFGQLHETLSVLVVGYRDTEFVLYHIYHRVIAILLWIHA